MRALLAVLLLLTLAFAGCASKGGDDDPSSTATGTSTGPISTSGTATGTATSSRTSSATSTSGPAGTNHPPTAGLSVVVNGTRAEFNLTGADQDGDALTWNLTFGDGQSVEGSVLPANATHSYAIGNYTAQITVSDGRESVRHNVTILATGGSGTGALLQTASVSWNAAFSGCLAEYPVIPPAEPAGNAAYGLVAVAPATIGHDYTAVFTWAAGPLPLGADISFYDADGMFVDGNLLPGAPPVTATGTVPAGAVFAIFTVCDAAASAAATYAVA